METLKLVIPTFKSMVKDFMGTYMFVPIFVLLVYVAIVYGYCFIADREILSINQKSSVEGYEYTLTAVCRPTDAFTSMPYIIVKANNLNILETSVNSGYDFTTTCLHSSVKNIQMIEDERKIKIYMKDGRTKEIGIIGYNSK